MSSTTIEREVRAGNRRVTSVWLAPSLPATSETPVPASAGAWVEKEQGTFARHTLPVPVTVGAALRIF